MRRLLLPLTLVIIAITAFVLSGRANEAADPGRATAATTDPSLVTPILSARRTPEWLRSPKADNLLAESVGDLLVGPDAPAELCVHVERDGVEIVSHNVTAAIASGDLHRLLTATAIDSVGSGTGFRTEIAIASDAEIVLDEETQTAVLNGDIYVIGGGDPTLATEEYVNRFGYQRTYTSFDELAAQAISALQDRKIVSVRGRVIGDETKYSPAERDYYKHLVTVGEFTLPVWDRKDGRDHSVGPLSALLLNDGFDSWPDEFDQAQNERSTNPPVSVAATFDDLLEAAGISVRSGPRAQAAPGLAERQTLAVVDSPVLTEIIARSLRDATTTEMLLKEYGIRGGGSSERGSATLTLATFGFAAAGLPFVVNESSTVYVDGSGRSAINATSCGMLHATISNPIGIGAKIIPERSESPVMGCGGTDGDLRIMATAFATGTGLVGHFTAPNNERITFAMVAADSSRTESVDGAEPLGPYKFCDPLQAAMVGAIVGHPYGPALTELAPLEPRSQG